jgi:hypothetical protein
LEQSTPGVELCPTIDQTLDNPEPNWDPNGIDTELLQMVHISLGEPSLPVLVKKGITRLGEGFVESPFTRLGPRIVRRMRVLLAIRIEYK